MSVDRVTSKCTYFKLQFLDLETGRNRLHIFMGIRKFYLK